MTGTLKTRNWQTPSAAIPRKNTYTFQELDKMSEWSFDGIKADFDSNSHVILMRILFDSHTNAVVGVCLSQNELIKWHLVNAIYELHILAGRYLNDGRGPRINVA